MKRFVSWVLAVAVSLAAASNCRADLPGDFKPLAAVVLSSVDNLANKLGNLALASSNPAMPRAIDSMKMGASAFGIDLAAPCGAFVAADKEGQPIFCAFLPIGNVGAYVAFLEKLPTVDSLELDDGVYAGKIKDGPEFFVQQKGKWVYTANNREVLANVPADPAKLLGDLPKRFDLAVKLFPANVTAEVCQKALDRFQEQFKAAQEAMPEQMVAQAAQRFKEAKLALPGMVAKINEAEDAFAGLLIDPGSNRVRLERRNQGRQRHLSSRPICDVAAGTVQFRGLLDARGRAQRQLDARHGRRRGGRGQNALADAARNCCRFCRMRISPTIR